MKNKRAKVQIYTPTHICTGYVYCAQRRLLDVVNGARAMRVNQDFLPLSEATMRLPDGSDTTRQSAYINKANLLFVTEIDGGETRGLAGYAGHKPYPFVDKWSTAVRLYMPLYTLNGQMHHAKGEGVEDVLNSGMRFLPLTNVEISPLGGSKERVSFVAVNKAQILSLEELGTTS